jgi:hypothetical protein
MSVRDKLRRPTLVRLGRVNLLCLPQEEVVLHCVVDRRSGGEEEEVRQRARRGGEEGSESCER